MALFSGPRWPHQAIPYIVTDGDLPTVTGWINRLNQRLGCTLFIPRLSIYTALPSVPENAYVSIRYIPGTPESAGVVGYIGPKEHRVKCADESRLIHELLHVLGFQHEQYHVRYGWINQHQWPNTPAHYNVDGTLNHAPTTQRWNEVLCYCINHEGGDGGTDGTTEFMKWQNKQNMAWVQGGNNRCDIWSAMMYRTCRKGVLYMLRLLRHAQTNVQWRQQRLDRNILNCVQVQQWIAPLTPAGQRYNLSRGDKEAIRRRYQGVNGLGNLARARWKDLTGRTGHTRSGDLVEVDKALESGNLERIKAAFDHWYNNNPKERTKRDKDNCVENLRTSLSRW